MKHISLNLVTTAACVVAVIALTAEGQNNLPSSIEFAPAHQAFAPPARGGFSSDTLCVEGEQIIFSCALQGSGKFASLCGSKKLTGDESYLQYRFGRLRNIEFEFPKEKEGSQKKFAYEHYFRARFDETEISFENGGYRYTLFDYYNGEQSPVRRQTGVRVKANGQQAQEVTLRCQSRFKAYYTGLPEVLCNQ